jgi:hypothetical protein
MHQDDLKTIWQCRDCGRNFIFHSDVEHHKAEFNHLEMTLSDFSSGKRAPARFTRGHAALGFRLDGRKARLTIEYKYYPSTDAISYIDVSYTDSKMQSIVESDPQMMKNIDSYLRKFLRQKQPKAGQ